MFCDRDGMVIEGTIAGFAPLNIAAADTLLDLTTAEAIRRHVPETEIRSPIPGNRTPFNLDRARQLIGWQPAHTWRE